MAIVKQSIDRSIKTYYGLQHHQQQQQQQQQ